MPRRQLAAVPDVEAPSAPGSSPGSLRCAKCKYDVNVKTAKPVGVASFECPTPGCGAVVFGSPIDGVVPIGDEASTAPPPPSQVLQMLPEKLEPSCIGVVGTDGRVVHFGPLKFSPVRFHTFDVGPAVVTVFRRAGETDAQLDQRAASEGAATLRAQFLANMELLRWTFETMYGPGSFEKSLGGDLVVTRR